MIRRGGLACWAAAAIAWSCSGGQQRRDSGTLEGGSAERPGETPSREAGPPPPPRPASRALALASHTCAVLDDGRVKCWGINEYGSLGLGSVGGAVGDQPGEMGDALPAVDLGTGRTAVAIAAAWESTCAILDDRRVKCWGNNQYGQLGLGDVNPRGDEPGEMGDALPAVDLGTGRTALALTAGNEFMCALLDDGSVRCWGHNEFGRLGLGDQETRGDQEGEMGDALPRVDLGTGRHAVALTAGLAHACALLDDGSVKCWGQNDQGQLGLGDVAARGDAAGEMGDALPRLELGALGPAVMLSTFWSHGCALLATGALKCWGANDGRLGIGDTAAHGDEPGEMGSFLPAVFVGTRWPVSVATGATSSCALLDDGHVKCWGMNHNGQLGLGDTSGRGDEPGEMGDALPDVDLGAGRTATEIAVGVERACAVLDTGALKCWGLNQSGELGLGDTRPRGVAPGDMGDALPTVDLGNGRSVRRGPPP